jgi:hypothetical protein
MDTDLQPCESTTKTTGPGWRWIPDHGIYLWWDGNQYTTRADWDGSTWTYFTPPKQRARATWPVRISMFVLAIPWFAVLIWGPTQLEEKPCFPSGSSGSAPSSTFTYTDVSGAVVPWFALLYLTIMGLLIWLAGAEDVRWIKRTMIGAVVVTALTCPLLIASCGAMNCGL